MFGVGLVGAMLCYCQKLSINCQQAAVRVLQNVGDPTPYGVVVFVVLVQAIKTDNQAMEQRMQVHFLQALHNGFH